MIMQRANLLRISMDCNPNVQYFTIIVDFNFTTNYRIRWENSESHSSVGSNVNKLLWNSIKIIINSRACIS